MSLNYTGKPVRRKRDDWHFFDLLPQELRQRIAAATLPWSSSQTIRHYRSLKKSYGHAKAVEMMLDFLDRADRHQAHETPWHRQGRTAEPTPCKLAAVEPLITSVAA